VGSLVSLQEVEAFWKSWSPQIWKLLVNGKSEKGESYLSTYLSITSFSYIPEYCIAATTSLSLFSLVKIITMD
jgi:restriction endonuclease S subunit